MPPMTIKLMYKQKALMFIQKGKIQWTEKNLHKKF